ncbi:transposase [Comamonas sp. GB3 AK4-5]|uniref:transposase n=1 Tax=Comamonas sp. GB3 AK4-5 TaxID=3231487 RepID=UPI00351DCCEC
MQRLFAKNSFIHRHEWMLWRARKHKSFGDSLMERRTAKRKSRSGAGSNGNRVTMTELDEKLSEWVGVARSSGPVIVDRYEAPWVCIVSYPTWHDISHLKSYIPGGDHELVSLREVIDNAFAYEGDALTDLVDRCESEVAPKFVIRAWVLQIVYSIGHAAIVREALAYNMLWRWFVGYTGAWEPLPKAEAFIHDMRMVSTDPRVVQVVHRCLSKNIVTQPELSEFRINFGLLDTLHAHYSDMKLGSHKIIPVHPPSQGADPTTPG